MAEEITTSCTKNKARPRTHLGLPFRSDGKLIAVVANRSTRKFSEEEDLSDASVSLIAIGQWLTGANQTSHEPHGPCQSRDCSRRGDHPWARMVPASQYRTHHKLQCAFLAGDQNGFHFQQHDERSGKKGSDQADSLSLFAGRTLAHLR